MLVLELLSQLKRLFEMLICKATLERPCSPAPAGPGRVLCQAARSPLPWWSATGGGSPGRRRPCHWSGWWSPTGSPPRRKGTCWSGLRPLPRSSGGRCLCNSSPWCRDPSPQGTLLLKAVNINKFSSYWACRYQSSSSWSCLLSVSSGGLEAPGQSGGKKRSSFLSLFYLFMFVGTR